MAMNAKDSVELLNKLARQAMLDRDLLPEFSSATLKEIEGIDSPTKLSQDTVDLRDKLWCSIDNDDSRDLDQLTYAEDVGGGKIKIFVAIADVSDLVHPETAIDHHAHYNTTSVYTPTKVFPMLHSKLSTNLTSLNPGVERNAIIAEVVIASDGSAESSKVYPGRVFNHAKLAYPSLSDWLNQAGQAPAALSKVAGLGDNIRLQDKAAQAIKKFRHKQGALSLRTIEAKPVFVDGKIVDIQERASNRAHELIENFMISANIAITQFLANNQLPTLRRVVRVPKRWDRIVEVAAEHGAQLPDTPDPVALEHFLVEMFKKDPVRFPDLSITMIKLLGKGEYVAILPGQKAPGHFDLAVKDYAHTTAPNRRYPDLIMQRLLKGVFNKQSLTYTIKDLNQIAFHCTAKEDDADKVERKMLKSAAALYLRPFLNREFEGIITGASEKGTWVRIFHPVVDGRLTGNVSNIDVGDEVKVKLIYLDVEKGFIDFVLVKKLGMA